MKGNRTMTYSPYGAKGSIVVTPRKVHASDRRLGTIGARLTDTKHGKAVRLKRTRPRHAVTTNRPKVERVRFRRTALPCLVSVSRAPIVPKRLSDA
jgi:hypothetical protein